MQTAALNKSVLEAVGYGDMNPDDFAPKEVALRDGRDGVVWVHRDNGHGILDSEFREVEDFYEKQYREEFSAKPGAKTDPEEHLRIYEGLNKKQFRSFSKFLGKDTKYLEIGCSFGGVLRKAASVVDVCHAVEPNREDADFVGNIISNAKVFNTKFEDAELEEDYYDVAVSIEVLEHVVAPRDFLLKCFRVLRPGGILHLEVPNHNDVLLSTYTDEGYNRFYYHKAHIHYFTKDSLLALCRECGFDGDVSSFLMYPFFNHVWWSQNHEPQGCAVSALTCPAPACENTAGGKAINEFYKKTESEYERLINENVLGDCLVFQGRKV